MHGWTQTTTIFKTENHQKSLKKRLSVKFKDFYFLWFKCNNLILFVFKISTVQQNTTGKF